MTVPAPGQDNPQVELLRRCLVNPTLIYSMKAEAALDALSADLEVATRERDEYLQMVFADMAAENKARRSYNAQGIRMRAERAERALEAARDALRFYANPSTYEEMAPLDEWEGRFTGPIPIKDFDHYGDRARSALDASASTENTP